MIVKSELARMMSDENYTGCKMDVGQSAPSTSFPIRAIADSVVNCGKLDFICQSRRYF